MNKADQMINRIHNLNLIISKEEKAVQLRASRLHFIKNNYIPTDQDLRRAALAADAFLYFLSLQQDEQSRWWFATRGLGRWVQAAPRPRRWPRWLTAPSKGDNERRARASQDAQTLAALSTRKGKESL